MKKYRYEYTDKFKNYIPLHPHQLFLDIETTGFDRSSTFLTIIGLAWQENETLIVEQWLNETGQSEEPLLLLELEKFLKNFSHELPKLVHYNGTTFDLPYLKAKYDQYHLPSSLIKCESLDLYHLSKKLRNFLSLDGLKQKNLEECFGLFREDKLSGQELIQVYLDGIRNRDLNLMDAYLLHNKEDMEGMVFLQNLIQINAIFEGDFEIQEWIESENGRLLNIKLGNNFYLYKPILISSHEIQFIFERGCIRIQIPVSRMEARFFYENYKDYYYLPSEDTAMHKSVAEYVEKEYRVKATKETCYTKKNAAYLPLPLPASSRLRKTAVKDCCSLDLFYLFYGDQTAYILKDISEECKRKLYLVHLLRTVL